MGRIGCSICKKMKKDIVDYGEWLDKNGIGVHYFCLLLSSELPQRGRCDNHGILGFLIKDIRKEIDMARKRLCFYCHKPNATIRCSDCELFFHLACGHQNGSYHQYCGEFRSYCGDCAALQDEIIEASKHKPSQNDICSLCYRNINSEYSVDFIYGTCCGRGYAHRECMQKFAFAAGYFLRCIWCNSNKFRSSVRKQGIFVPDRDAQWDDIGEEFAKIFPIDLQCNAEKCLCDKGRGYTDSQWDITVCKLCAAFSVHNPQCIPNKKHKMLSFQCSTCEDIEIFLQNGLEPCVWDAEESILNVLSTRKLSKNIATEGHNYTPSATTEDSVRSEATENRKCDSNMDMETKSSGKSLEELNSIKFEFDLYKFNESNMTCYGRCKYKIKSNHSPEIADKTIQEILDSKHIQNGSIIEETTDCGIFDIVDKIIEEYI